MSLSVSKFECTMGLSAQETGERSVDVISCDQGFRVDRCLQQG